jgi:GTPase SAR1 family protein
MIVVFFGQPHSGKTTLATELQRQLFILERASYPLIDGDEIRLIFKNKDYSREGRIKNLNRISDISTFLAHQYRVVMVSAVYPIKEAREYFESIHEEVIWVYLTYNEPRGREGFHVEDFNEPQELKNLIKINTTENGIEECIQKILPVYWSVSGSPRRSQVPVQE